MINQFQKCGYNRLLIEQQIDNVTSRERTTFERKRKTLLQPSLYQSNTTEHSLK